MATSWLELRGADRCELEDVAAEVAGAAVDFSGVGAGALEGVDLPDEAAADLAAEIDAALEAAAEDFPGFCAEEFVNELGRRGWEILPPKSAEFVSGVIEELFARRSAQNVFKAALPTVKMRRPRRVKKLRRTT